MRVCVYMCMYIYIYIYMPWELSGRFRYVSVVHVSVAFPPRFCHVSVNVSVAFPVRFRCVSGAFPAAFPSAFPLRFRRVSGAFPSAFPLRFFPLGKCLLDGHYPKNSRGIFVLCLLATGGRAHPKQNLFWHSGSDLVSQPAASGSHPWSTFVESALRHAAESSDSERQMRREPEGRTNPGVLRRFPRVSVNVSVRVSATFPSTFPERFRQRFRYASVTFPLGRRVPDGNYPETLPTFLGPTKLYLCIYMYIYIYIYIYCIYIYIYIYMFFATWGCPRSRRSSATWRRTATSRLLLLLIIIIIIIIVVIVMMRIIIIIIILIVLLIIMIIITVSNNSCNNNDNNTLPIVTA